MVQEHGGVLSFEDLEKHNSTFDDPICTCYRGINVWEMPPNGQGITALLALNILEGFDIKGEHFSQQNFLWVKPICVNRNSNVNPSSLSPLLPLCAWIRAKVRATDWSFVWRLPSDLLKKSRECLGRCVQRIDLHFCLMLIITFWLVKKVAWIRGKVRARDWSVVWCLPSDLLNNKTLSERTLGRGHAHVKIFCVRYVWVSQCC